MSLVQRQLTFIFTLGQDRVSGAQKTFQGSVANTLTLQNHRAKTVITNAGGVAMGNLDAEVYGMTLPEMKDLSTLGMNIAIVDARDTVTVQAGNAGELPTTVFVGNIIQAWIDFRDDADVAFHVSAASMGGAAVLGAPASGAPGGVDVATVLSNLAKQVNLTFENNGVTAQLSKQYLWGSVRDQIVRVVEAAGIEWNCGEGGVLAIWPKTGNRGGLVPLISPSTGMISYPAFTQNGIQVRTIFNPSIKYGGLVNVESSLTYQSVKVMGLDHQLDAQVPHGRWFSTIRGYNPGLPIAPPQR